MKNKLAVAITAAAVLLGTSTSASALTNISFETGLSPWSPSGTGTLTTQGSYAVSLTGTNSYSTTVLPYPSAPVGNNFAALFSAGSSAGDSDLYTLQNTGGAIGAGYTLYYRYITQDFGGGSSNKNDTFAAQTWNGSTWSSLFTLASKTQSQNDSTWLSIALPSSATGLRFVLNGDGDTLKSYAFVDVSPVPEPGEWAMMLAGFGLIGFIANRKRRRND